MRTPYGLGVVILALLAGCGTTSATGSARDGMLTGQVLAGPVCPVERAESPCPPRPVSGATVQLLTATEVVKTTRTDTVGRFLLSAAPGRYVVRATHPGGYASTASKPVTLSTGDSDSVTLTLDTGIR